MTKRFRYSTCLFAIVLFILGISIQKGFTQTPGVKFNGQVIESGSGMPLKQVLISVSSSGVSTQTDDNGAFSIIVPDKQAEILIELPGYNKRSIYILGRDSIKVSLVSSKFKSMDNMYYSPLGVPALKDATYSVSVLNGADVDFTRSTTFDQNIQGKVPGVRVVEYSGMPGSRTWMNIRGISSLYGKNQPLLFVDGMIHDYDYTNYSLMEGFALNPMDVIDIEDIADISVLKNGSSYLGGASTNGVVTLNTEQKSEASTIINVSAYTGLSMTPKSQDVIDATTFKSYLDQIINENKGADAPNYIDVNVPWLKGDNTSPNYYKYNNSTDWQKEIFKKGILQKYHMFIKGGDEIATYNISTGYLKQDGIYSKSNFSRFNLRVNGKVNITDKFSVAPNVKLSLADTYLPNQGFSANKNPILSALTKPPIMAIYARDPLQGVQLPYLDNVENSGLTFPASNPVAVAENSIGTNRDYNFLSSVNVQFRIPTLNLTISNTVGVDFNNSRESIFIPGRGISKIGVVENSAGDLTSEYRSTQNHTTITYSKQSVTGHSLEVNAGLKYIENTYKDLKLTDLNSPSDYFKNLGAGSGTYKYLRTSIGDDWGILWLSYFGTVSYNYLSKYYFDANFSYEGTSAIAKKNRYNIYPSFGAAWRISSESFLSQESWLEDLKLRASWSQTGNMFSSVYDLSRLYYIETRVGSGGALLREGIPNTNMEIEKKNTINVGIDVSLFKQITNIHVDYYKSSVNNLLIYQQLPDNDGYTSNYYDNGGTLENSGIEIAADQRFQLGPLTWTIGATLAKQTNEITGLKFINPNQKKIVTTVEGPVGGAQYVTSVGNVANAFYGYKTNGIYNDAAEANAVTGPKRSPMQIGDVRFVDVDQNNIIDDADKTIIGNPNPDLFGGFSTLFSFKGLELSAFFTYSMGNDAFNYVKYKTESMDQYYNQSNNVLKRWTASNHSTTMPRASFGDPTGNTVFSDRWIEDASYIRFKQLTLSYSLPSTRYYKGITVYVTAANLLTITKYKGYDPEFNYTSNPYNMGIDYGSIPQTRSFIVGLKLGL
jgi:TonB-linked SusC/RagA family outer membrane protein